ncbi:hypothetical protein DIE04_08110 [Burkholderia sp. Bp8994]|nr:hypothetical protein DIE20_16335 [Burkholderia sp. Bp9131]RQR76398.1 hypothetical protein DIE12_08050 [Burkholderia sp. Bp9015]RQR99723.1 hypothetical protein DIE04_08110 [Burkholderia sp. Bp8994]RQS28306.1 hypothetical protein DIE05_15525 [Burkholderia sp. Bp8995]RQS43014.1 hypothetical protein DIE01_07760 [Burkholderia sp. Bp8990]RQS46541.1 hypothetical protein DIE00_16870 [Burkholderia sp. Bp8989]RQS59754.1 hypothetical protein DID98_15445 [Burkholderia sp. Bp8984]RQZ44812.1 hypothetic
MNARATTRMRVAAISARARICCNLAVADRRVRSDNRHEACRAVAVHRQAACRRSRRRHAHHAHWASACFTQQP